MKNKTIDSELLLTYLKDKKITTIDELKSILKTQCEMTVFRKLSMLGYISSYSHSGKYYSLKRIARYNKYGIWTYKSVLFLKRGLQKGSGSNYFWTCQIKCGLSPILFPKLGWTLRDRRKRY